MAGAGVLILLRSKQKAPSVWTVPDQGDSSFRCAPNGELPSLWTVPDQGDFLIPLRSIRNDSGAFFKGGEEGRARPALPFLIPPGALHSKRSESPAFITVLIEVAIAEEDRDPAASHYHLNLSGRPRGRGIPSLALPSFLIGVAVPEVRRDPQPSLPSLIRSGPFRR